MKARMLLPLITLAGCASPGLFTPPPVGSSGSGAFPPARSVTSTADTILPVSVAGETTTAKTKLSAPMPTTIELGRVLESVEQHFPLLLAIGEERALAAGQRLTAEGAFDTNVRSRAQGQNGTFDNGRFDVGIEQYTPWNGIALSGGYRLSLGDYPPYYGYHKTGDGGEFRGGLTIPWLRNAPIDRQRATLRQAQIAENLADPVIQRARLDYLRSATRSYWNWMAAGEQYQVAQELLKLAQDRQASFETQFQRGAIAEIIVIDNRRLIAERRGSVAQAERRWQQTSIELSLFLRDDNGQPWLPTPSQLPRTLLSTKPTSPQSTKADDDILLALTHRPELKRFAFLRDRISVDLQLANNQLLPNLSTGVSGFNDLGPVKKNSDGTPGDARGVEANLLLEMPLQWRDASGRQAQARALLTQVQWQEQFAREQITTDVQDALSNLDRTRERIERAQEEVQVAQQVTELELTRFRLGQSTLLEVNLRELAAAGAKIKLIEAIADFQRAIADYRAATAIP